MAKAGFKLNRRTVAEILKSDEGRAALRVVAEQIRERAGAEAFLEEYETDRAVVGVMVPADQQARHGVATRAANEVAGR